MRNLRLSAGFKFLLVLLAWLLASASAQSQKVARIGFLAPASKPYPSVDVVAKALRDVGYVEGQNAVFDIRHADFQPDRLRELAGDLVRQRADVIIAFTNVAGFAAKNVTDRVPIVVWGIHGAIETGLVRSLARPGANLTGIETLAPVLDVKRLELIKQSVPKLARLGVLYNAEDQGAPVHLASVSETARALGVNIMPIPVKRLEDFEAVLSAAVASIDGLMTFTDPLTGSGWRRKVVAGFVSRHRLPTVCEFKFLAESGCMMSYGPSFDEQAAVIARQVDKILKGAKAGDLPVEQVTRFEMIVNMKTAKELGVTIPNLVLLQADKVIE